MSRFGDDTNPQRYDYNTLHGINPDTKPQFSDEPPYYFDSEKPFTATQPAEPDYEDRYMGLIMNGPFKNFNLYAWRSTGCMIIVFGRVTPLLRESFEHLCDKDLPPTQNITCPHCQEVIPMYDNEPETDCTNCEGYVRNPNFKELQGNPEYEAM